MSSVRARITAMAAELERLEKAPHGERERARGLLHEVLEAHRAGLSRMLQALSGDEVARLCEDVEVAALLMLHGLHPLPLRERVEKAVANLAPRVAAQHATLSLVSIADEGHVIIRVEHAGKRGALHEMIEEALAVAAADAADVQIEERIAVPVNLDLLRRGAAR
jgi:hypothetical protein